MRVEEGRGFSFTEIHFFGRTFMTDRFVRIRKGEGFLPGGLRRLSIQGRTKKLVFLLCVG